MQIGNKGDPAFDVLKNSAEGSHLIMGETLLSDIKADNINNPVANVQAGIAYLYTRMAKFDIKSVTNTKDKTVHTHKVIAKDTLDGIGKAKGTTVEVLKKLNPGVSPTSLRIGQVLKYRKAARKMVITGWRAFDTQTISDRYNGGGDPKYKAKLDYIMKEIFPNLKRPKK